MVHVMSERRSTDLQGLDNLTEIRKNMFTRFYFVEASVSNLYGIILGLSREVNPCHFWHPHVIDAVTAERSKKCRFPVSFGPLTVTSLIATLSRIQIHSNQLAAPNVATHRWILCHYS